MTTTTTDAAPSTQSTLATLDPSIPTLIIMRGAPGSGKSHLARRVRDELHADPHKVLICSTDDYFLDNAATYVFDATRLGEAHAWNLDRASRAMRDRTHTFVVVDNTNMARWEARPYVVVAVETRYAVRVLEPDTEWWRRRDCEELARRNSHGVGVEVITRMVDRYEPDFSVEAILASERPPPPEHHARHRPYRG